VAEREFEQISGRKNVKIGIYFIGKIELMVFQTGRTKNYLWAA
jgi:hypothetical protein